MATEIEQKHGVAEVTAETVGEKSVDEKVNPIPRYESEDEISIGQVEGELVVTEKDLHEAQEFAKNLGLEEVRDLMANVLKLHELDPNFPPVVIDRIKSFLGNPAVFENPEKHADLIQEMKIQAALITNNSPYAEVRAVVDNHDDFNMPVSTIRAYVIGLFFVVVLAFINQLFEIRQPPIKIGPTVAQLLAFPVGKAAEYALPDWGFILFGKRLSLNPGKFNKKEHMLITIMATAAYNTPYTNNIIWIQYLPRFFNQSYAGAFSYQILIALGTNFIGYGLAGICRKFLVYPAHCVWPKSLVTIALNSAFHDDTNNPVLGPFKKVFKLSRYHFFLVVFTAMFFYFWLPGYLFTALSMFSWITWIAPNNVNLSAICGFNNGLGLNPWPTFDWNILLFDEMDPFMVPFFNTINKFVGAFISMFVIIGVWYSNAWNTSYLPINSNRVFDHFGEFYNVSRAINEKGMFDREKYEAYSPAHMAAGNLVLYLFFFAIYTAVISYTYLYHRHEIMMGLKALFTRNKKGGVQYTDVHNRLMSVYPEVSEWYYIATLLVATSFAIAGIAGWETYTTPGVVFYGLALCILFVVPIGIIKAITGIEVTLNVLAEFIGGSWVAGNALAMNYFKSFGYVTCAHAVQFSNDLKLAHYLKIPPWHTFIAQMIATLVSTFVCTGVLNFQMNQIKDVCTPQQASRFTCPGINTFFTAAVLWGTIGPHKVFGKGGQYTWLLLGFPLGAVLPFAFYYLQKRFPAKKWLRQVHPVVLMYGGIQFAPYNLSYVWPAVPVGWLSMVYVKKRYLAFWAKYNYVASASFSGAIACAAIIIFFALQWSDVAVSWWGNDVTARGCEGDACTRFTLAEGQFFGPGVGGFKG